MEAIRNEKEQKRYAPLMAYQDEESMGLNARPWQQVVMFIARTIKPHQWESPKYRFTQEQKRQWRRMVGEARSEVERQKADESSSGREGRQESWQSGRGRVSRDQLMLLTTEQVQKETVYCKVYRIYGLVTIV